MSVNITLSWDLFIIVFFALVITYSFIIGKHESIKIILATYVAIVAVRGIGNIMARLTGDSQPILTVLGLSVDFTLITTVKLVFFVAFIIFLAVRGGLEIEYTRESGSAVNTILTGLFGFATAGLLLSSLMSIVGAETVAPIVSSTTESVVSSIPQQSTLVQTIMANQDLWFSLPALLLVGVGIMSHDADA